MYGRYLPFLFFYLLATVAAGQTTEVVTEGKITYTTSKSVYVRFVSTEKIAIGDTLYSVTDSYRKQVLVVRQKSSTSCVTDQLDPAYTPQTGQTVVHLQYVAEKNDIPPQVAEIHVTPAVTFDEAPGRTKDSLDVVQTTGKVRKQTLNGRLTVTSNGMLNPDDNSNFQRIRSAFSMNVQNIGASALSAQVYATYRYRYGIDQSTTDFYNDFKIFALALEYAPDKPYRLWAGRRINSHIANLGTIDGIQGEYSLGRYAIGAFAGTRPDVQNFSFAASLPQFGMYAVRNDQLQNGGSAQTTLSVSEQQNEFRTDRRFFYFQHNNNLVKRLTFFLSSEIDLYKKENGISTSQLSLTSLYASLRYRIRNNLSISGSYDNRRNVIYYESYQTFIDQLLAEETRQGLRCQLTYSPFKFININTSAFWRYQGTNPQPTTNYVANLSIMNLPGAFQAIHLSANWLESYYFTGQILGGRMNGQFFKGKLGIELQYRNVRYTFFNAESTLTQHTGGASLSLQLLKKTTLMLNYEGTFEPARTYHRYFVTFVQRFKQ